MTKRLFTVALMGLGLLTTQASADPSLRKVRFTFKNPVAVPGATLPAGSYEFMRVDPDTGRHIVRIRDANTMKVLATVPAVQAVRLTVPEKPAITFTERAKGAPPAVSAWWYPGESIGMQLVYFGEAASPTTQIVTD
jgi:hypothetical protein